MNNFASSLAQDLGIAHKGQWNMTTMDIAEATASVSRLNNCPEEVAVNVLASLEPYTRDPRCNSIFFGAVAAHPGAVDNGEATSLENASFIDIQNPANNVWGLADVSGDLSVVYCNGFVVGLVGIAPAGVDLETYSANVVPNIPNWLYGFMGFVNLVSEGEDGVVSMMLGLVDGSGADLEWFEFDTAQTAYLVAKNLFLSGAAFNSILYRAAMYGRVPINGVLFENNDILAELLIQAIDLEASGVVDVTPVEEVEDYPEEESEEVAPAYEEEQSFEDDLDLEEGDDLFSGDLDSEDGEDIFADEDENLDTEEGSEDGDLFGDEEFDELPLEEISDEVEDAEEEYIDDFDELPEDDFYGDLTEEVEDDFLANLEDTDTDFLEDADTDFLDESDLDFEPLDSEVLSADEDIEYDKYQPEAVSLGRDDLVTVLRRVLGASDDLITLIIGEKPDRIIDRNTPVNIDAVCHVLASEFYSEEIIQSFILLADQYSDEESSIKCGIAVEVLASAIWGDVPEYSRVPVENHAATILNRHRDELWLGVYHTDAVVERLTTLGYNGDVCYRVAILMEQVKADIDIMREKLINE